MKLKHLRAKHGISVPDVYSKVPGLLPIILVNTNWNMLSNLKLLSMNATQWFQKIP